MRVEGYVQSAIKFLQIRDLTQRIREKKTAVIMNHTERIVMFSLLFVVSLVFIYLTGLHFIVKPELSRLFHTSVISAFCLVFFVNAYCLSSYRREQALRALRQQEKIAAILETFDECNENVSHCVKENIQNPVYLNSYPVHVALSVHLKALGLPEETRDMKIIKERYRKLAKQYHPDTGVNPNTAELTIINNAYQKIRTFL